ncbi:unnamed protein product [Diplocarpon coronariae]
MSAPGFTVGKGVNHSSHGLGLAVVIFSWLSTAPGAIVESTRSASIPGRDPASQSAATFQKDWQSRYPMLSLKREKEMRTIRVGRLVYKVHRNLREALRYLRHADRPRTLWIDALCINQLDTEERNHQIGQMSMVYSRASKVVA